MFKYIQVVALALLCLSTTAFAEDPSPVLTDEEVGELIELSNETQAALLERVSGLTDEQWNFKPGPDRWSVGECVEHIALAERGLLDMVKQTLAGPADPEWATKSAGKLAIIKQAVPNRGPRGQGGFQAPEPMQPVNKWDRAKGIEEFYAAHGYLRGYLETMDRRIKDRGMPHPAPQLGWMNGNDWLHLILLHTVRHTKQIIEVQEDPNYPKGHETTGGR